MENIFTEKFWNQLSTELQDKIINFFVSLPEILIPVFALVVGTLILLRVIRSGIKRLEKTLLRKSEKQEESEQKESQKRINTIINIILGVIKITIWAIVFMIILKKLGIDIGPILASAGILGLAIGFGAQELVRDFISGFFLILENHVREGDVAVINGTAGLVESIGLRTITLRDLSGIVHVFQNGKINSLSNKTKEWSAMVLDIGVAYKEDVNEVIQVIKNVGDELNADPEFGPKMLEPIEVLGLDQFASSSIVIRARIKTKPGDQWSTSREFRKRLKYAFDKASIEIPFPHTTIYWGEEIKPLKLDKPE